VLLPANGRPSPGSDRYVRVMLSGDLLTHRTFRVAVVPARAAYLTASRSSAGFRRAVQEACTRWGGATEPILQVSPAGKLSPWNSRCLSSAGGSRGDPRSRPNGRYAMWERVEPDRHETMEVCRIVGHVFGRLGPSTTLNVPLVAESRLPGAVVTPASGNSTNSIGRVLTYKS
jgi:hypothetical protein